MSSSDITDIPIRITVPPATGKAASIRPEVCIDPSRLQFARAHGRQTASVVLAVWYFDGSDHVIRDGQNPLQLSFTDTALEELGATWIPVSLDVPVASGTRQIKVVVYQYETDRVGSAFAKIR